MSKNRVESITTVVVDDEPLARQRLARLLERESDVVVIAQCSDGASAIDEIAKSKPDVVFVDIRMPGLNGFETLERLGEATPWVVFVTAYAEYAVRAFEVRALDYLLKPVDPDRLARTIARIRDQSRDVSSVEERRQLAGLIAEVLQEQNSAHTNSAREHRRYPERLLLKDGAEASFLQTDKIRWIEAAGNYVKIHTATGLHLVRRTISELERTLDPEQFIRIHRSTIVNLRSVDRLSPAFAGAYFVHLNDGEELVLSRGYRAKLFDRIGDTL